MAILARWQATIVDENGTILPGSSIEVRHETSGSPLATLFSDRAGVVSIGNPFVADAEGFAAFHVAGGAYKITATNGAFSRVWRYVGLGTASESDALSEGSGLSLPALSAINWNSGDVTITHSPNALAFAGASSGYSYDNTITVTGTTAGFVGLNLISTDAGAAAGPLLLFDRNSASPAASDTLGQLLFRGRDSNNNATDYATIYGRALAVTDGAETGSILFDLMQAGVLTTTAVFEATTPPAFRPSSSTPTLVLGSSTVPWASTFTTAIELGNASDTTLARASAGDVSVEGNRIFRVGGVDVPVADGGTGVSSFTAYAVICGGTTSTGGLQSIASVGSAGNVLTSNGAGALPTFQGVSASALTLLTSGTVSSAAQLDLVLTTYSAYRALLFKLFDFLPATDNNTFQILFSTDGGSTFISSGYDYASLSSQSDSATTDYANSASAALIQICTEIASDANYGISMDLTFPKPLGTTRPRVWWDGVHWDVDDDIRRNYGSGGNVTAQDTDAVRFKFTTGNIGSGTYAVYGYS